MSVVVAIKRNGIIYMGCDSQVTRGGTRTSLTNPNNYKIWKVNDVDNCLMGHSGAIREANAIKVMDGLVSELAVIHDNVNFSYVVRRVVPKIIDELKEYNYIDDSNVFEGMESRFIFAYKDKLFAIGADGSVIEVDDMVAIGSGESEAIGSLLSTGDIDPNEKIIKAIKATAAHDLYVDYPIVLSNTETCEFKTILE